MAKPTSQLPMDLAPQRDVYTVSRLNREARAMLEGRFQSLWLEGEVSNFARPASGHWYFSLKDAQAQVRCAMFRQNNMRLKFLPEDGMHVLVRARVSLYEGRGEFQLIVEHAEPAGEGLLRLQFEQLKLKLAAEGLFADSAKKPLPSFPETVGVITSPTGAAIRDILSVLRRRAPHIEVIIYPVPVQGSTAAPQIAAMIATADDRDECDVLLLARGGGSLEDLWPFNEEVVARAIYACRTPIVSGVGHEIDFTITDFVADMRAPTPSAAAELISPDRRELLALLRTFDSRMSKQIRDALTQQRQRLAWLTRRMVHPGRRLQELAQRLDDVSARLASSLSAQLQRRAVKVAQISARLHAQSPAQRLRLLREQLSTLRLRLAQSIGNGLKNCAVRLSPLGRALHAVSPLATLDRGYAIVSTTEAKILRDAKQVRRGDKIIARLARGKLNCAVESIDIDVELK
ncbi:MAG: exodeoxyribonuclease VII large subunit [Gammaproteobacteria bacterium]